MNPKYWIYCSLLAVLTSCSLTKKLAPESKVYMGTEVVIEDPKSGKSIAGLKHELQDLALDGTQAGLGNVLVGLHNMYDEVPEKGFRHWVKHRLGEEPIVYKPSIKDNSESRLGHYLRGKGFFDHSLSCDTSSHKRKLTVKCTVDLGERFRLDSLVFPVDSTYLSLSLDYEGERAILKEGDFYDRQRLEYEQVRLSTLAGELGFLDFRSRHVHFYVDTAKSDALVDIYTKIIQPSDSTRHKRYFLDSIRIYTNHSLSEDSDTKYREERVTNTMTVLENNHYVDHDLLDRMILLNPGNPYNSSLEKRSISRLLDLGLFKFVDFNKTRTKSGHSIIQEIQLTPDKLQNISGELELNNRSGNFVGTGAQINYLHRNLFKHAERFTFNLGAQVETQIGNNLSFINSSDFSIGTQLTVPRYIFPFIDIREGRSFVPQTVFRLNYTQQRRTSFYSLSSAIGKFGYIWRENAKVRHELFPFTLNQIEVSRKSPEFEELLQQDQRLANSFENTLIGGIEYNLIFSNQTDRSDRKYQYFRGELETSGNLFNLLSKDDELFGRKYAQFAKLTLEFRRYVPWGRSNLVGRLLLGTGLAYGVSSELPYIRQFFIGGSNSLRAFRIRGLGPGTSYADLNNLDDFAGQFVDQTGDIKLEINLEARFPLFRYLKGALFIDAGNVWLIDEPNRPETEFEFSDFIKEVAIGTGAGLRLDFDIFLVRFDLAFPLRAPTLDSALQWQFSQIRPFSKFWRQNNLRLNIGLGYPF